MNTNNDIIVAARNELGTWEWAGAENNPAVVQYFADSGNAGVVTDSTPWCAAFVGSILAKNGINGTGSLLARSYENWGVPVMWKDRQAGDICVVPRGNSDWQGHVFFYDGMDGNKARGLGGNQGDQVSHKLFTPSSIIALRRQKPPRKNFASSKTTIASSAIVLSTMGNVSNDVKKLIGNVTETFGMSPSLLMLLVVLGAVGYIIWSRRKKWLAGVR